MADERAEEEARARGDVNRGAMATVCGACVGGAIGIELVAPARLVAVADFARESFSGGAAPEAALRHASALLAGIALPVAGLAAIGALAVGLAQTRVFLAGPGVPEPPDGPAPARVLAVVGWLALALLALDGLRAVFGLAAAATPVAIASGAARLADHLVRLLLVGVVALALVDHLLRARARRERLTVGPSGRARAAGVPEPGPEELLAGAERVLYDGERVVVVGRVGGRRVALARVSGLVAQSVIDAARRRGLAVRSASPAVLAELPIGRELARDVDPDPEPDVRRDVEKDATVETKHDAGDAP